MSITSQLEKMLDESRKLDEGKMRSVGIPLDSADKPDIAEVKKMIAALEKKSSLEPQQKADLKALKNALKTGKVVNEDDDMDDDDYEKDEDGEKVKKKKKKEEDEDDDEDDED